MHKIERLLQTLAPKGVEFRKLGEVCDFQNGFTFQRKNFRNTGLPIIRISNIQNDRLLLDEVIYFSLNDYKGTNFEPFKITKGDILIAMSGATTGKIGILTFDTTLYLNQRVGKFKPNITKLNNKFLYYFLLTKINFLYSLAGGGAQPNLSSNQILQQITIPIPPLEIQQEIVKILDAFTELNTELNTELKARKKQYEYYQNMLLDFKDIHQNHKDAKMSAKTYPKRLKSLLQTLAPNGVEFRKLGDMTISFTKQTGFDYSAFIKPTLIKEYLPNYIPFIQNKDFLGHYINYKTDYFIPNEIAIRFPQILLNEKCLLISISGSIGKVAVFNHSQDAFIGGAIAVLKFKEKKSLDFVMHFLMSASGQKLLLNGVKSGSHKNLTIADLKKITIPIPPLEIQQEIVKILDQFSLLTTDLLAGIPAEIKARKKQYEYYREKLLAFKPLKA